MSATVLTGRVYSCEMKWAALVVLAACGPRTIPPGTPDQTIHDAMVLVCGAPGRADSDRSSASRSDKIAGHLTDGIGNVDVLTTVEGWKTDGIKRSELDALLA